MTHCVLTQWAIIGICLTPEIPLPRTCLGARSPLIPTPWPAPPWRSSPSMAMAKSRWRKLPKKRESDARASTAISLPRRIWCGAACWKLRPFQTAPSPRRSRRATTWWVPCTLLRWQLSIRCRIRRSREDACGLSLTSPSSWPRPRCGWARTTSGCCGISRKAGSARRRRPIWRWPSAR